MAELSNLCRKIKILFTVLEVNTGATICIETNAKDYMHDEILKQLLKELKLTRSSDYEFVLVNVKTDNKDVPMLSGKSLDCLEVYAGMLRQLVIFQYSKNKERRKNAEMDFRVLQNILGFNDI